MISKCYIKEKLYPYFPLTSGWISYEKNVSVTFCMKILTFGGQALEEYPIERADNLNLIYKFIPPTYLSVSSCRTQSPYIASNT